jgi:gliding motility-associated-like protein
MRQLLLIVTLVCFNNFIVESQVNLTQGLVAYYPFNGNANDVSGNGHHGIGLNGLSYAADINGTPNTAALFDGVDDFIEIADNGGLLNRSAMSFSMQVKPQSTVVQTLLAKQKFTTASEASFQVAMNYAPYNGAYWWVQKSNNTFCGSNSSPSATVVNTGTDLLPNAWYCLAGTYADDTIKIYLNGVLIQKNYNGPGLIDSCTNHPVRLGRWNEIGPTPFKGIMDEVRIYNRALNQQEVQTLSVCNTISSCTNWLDAPSQGSAVMVGDLDVTGNQLTVEANFNRTVPLNNGIYYGHLVSKHTGASNANYALLPNGCEISTTNGYFSTFQTCVPSINKTYHVAMVYDGATLKFYRNGFLLSSQSCTGNIVSNDLLTTIAQISSSGSPPDNQFLGNINEVRIWNVARTQSQLKTYMNTSLPNPATQTGLLGYYTFDNLLNKQGNAAYNGTLAGAATINQTNPNCSFVADSCPVNTPISNIINDYTPVLNFNPCDNKLIVEDGTKFNAGDTILLIQMKGAVIDSSNTAAFGSITDYKSAGNYEFNYVKSRAGNIVELKNKITRSYEVPAGRVQLIRVPYYQNATISNTLTSLPWDGSKGGVLVFKVKDTLELNGDIDVDGKGFLKGVMRNSNSNTFTCGIKNYYFQDNTKDAAGKGEGITSLSTNRNSGIGPAANGGGGGMNTNTGGGGGSNGNLGGRGGYEYSACPNYLNAQNWGLPGKLLSYNTASNKVFLGGAGGAGHCNNQFDDLTAIADFNGGNGGGIVLVSARYIKNNNKKITAKGEKAYELNVTNSFISHDGMGGGGAGGTVLLNIDNYVGNIAIDVSGGKGGNMVSMTAGGLVGPGGGGGGGTVWVKQSSVPGVVNVIANGGLGGVIIQDSNNPYGASNGLNGIALGNLSISIDTILFKRNIDSVRIKDSATACKTFDFKGLSFTNTTAITQWQWFFGDGGTANTQNTSHTYTNANTTYTVKLVVTDINGCKDSVAKNITTGLSTADAGPDTSFCSNNSVSVTLQATGGNGYSWTPAGFLNNSAIANPEATVSSTTKFYVTVTSATGCTGIDSVTVFIRPLPLVKTLTDTALCKNTSIVLTTSGATTYVWHPGINLSDSTIANPIFTGNQSQQLIVTGTNAATGCKANDTISITVNLLPHVKTIADTVICSVQTITLTTTGAQIYQWDPAVFLSNPNAVSPVFNGTSSQTYEVTGTDANGCAAKDTVAVTLVSLAGLQAPPDKVMCLFKTVTLDGNNGTGYQYAWNPATGLSNTGIENPVCNVTATTPYLVTITEPQCNLQRNFNVIVTVNPLPNVNVTKENDIDCSMPFSNLSATGAVQYAWLPITGLNNAFIANPVAVPGSNTLYIVKGTDFNGCINYDSVEVKVLSGGKDFTEIPNSFTPNNDGINDCFGPGKFWRNIVSQEFMVYNRWGERVFYSTNTGGCWSGNYKGVEAEAGSYVYYLKAKTICGFVAKKGIVLLIR